ncbi:hypothetical protein VN97_g2968 [Penicillium thymicola]|uniref:Uncharacterized protein n=1 Tax=Penicillium thymicola TaxID=293382 RepID=A0AAI9XB99_PENTH|nr:hypothetical protein VN97_g2968 [Penicillium thymicola]
MEELSINTTAFLVGTKRDGKKRIDRRRDRTCNLLIRSQAPCHWASRPCSYSNLAKMCIINQNHRHGEAKRQKRAEWRQGFESSTPIPVYSRLLAWTFHPSQSIS